MTRVKDNSKQKMKQIGIEHCESCKITDKRVLTIHHIFKRREYQQQPKFDRKFRYIVLCLNCHALAELNVMTDELREIIKKRLLECERVYGQNKLIDRELFQLGLNQHNKEGKK